MNPIAISLGPIKIYWYSIIILLAIILASKVLFKQAKKQNIKEDFLTNLIFYGVLWGILGARLYYVLFNLKYYLQNPIEIIEIYNGGLAIHGGIIAGAIFFIYYSKKNKINFLKIFDLTAPALILGQAIGRWGNFINQEAHGTETTLPWAVIIDGKRYHPTFLYESIGNLLVFTFLMIYIRKYQKKKGEVVLLYAIFYGVVRFFVEGLRTDSLMFLGFRVSQVLSLVGVIVGSLLFFLNRKYGKDI